MAATGTVHVQCPECDVVVPIATEPRSTTSECNRLMIVFEPDLTDVWAHAWTHEQD